MAGFLLRRVIVLWVTAVTVMTVILGCPPREPPTVTAHSSIQSRKAQDGQGVSPALRESRGNVWHTTLQGKV